MTQKPKFIAGAICPSCREVDRIVVEQVAEMDEQSVGEALRQRRCVTCGYTDAHVDAVGFSVPEGARDKSAHKPKIHRQVDERISAVKIIDPKKS